MFLVSFAVTAIVQLVFAAQLVFALMYSPPRKLSTGLGDGSSSVPQLVKSNDPNANKPIIDKNLMFFIFVFLMMQRYNVN